MQSAHWRAGRQGERFSPHERAASLAPPRFAAPPATRRLRRDEAARLALAELTLSQSLAGGAEYADIRVGATFPESSARARSGSRPPGAARPGALACACCGAAPGAFAGATSLTPDAIRRAVETALANARAVEPIQGEPIELEALPAVEDRWEMALGIDPFAVPIAKKADLLLAANAAARDAGADFCTSQFTAAREERLFANSRGGRICRRARACGPSSSHRRR